jgi:hypothetical protein
MPKVTMVVGLREGVHTAQRSAGTFIAIGIGSVGGSVSYDEFLDGKRPK